MDLWPPQLCAQHPSLFIAFCVCVWGLQVLVQVCVCAHVHTCTATHMHAPLWVNDILWLPYTRTLTWDNVKCYNPREEPNMVLNHRQGRKKKMYVLITDCRSRQIPARYRSLDPRWVCLPYLGILQDRPVRWEFCSLRWLTQIKTTLVILRWNNAQEQIFNVYQFPNINNEED